VQISTAAPDLLFLIFIYTIKPKDHTTQHPELRLHGSGTEHYDPEVLRATGTASLWFRARTLWSGSPPGHGNSVSMVPARNSMIRKSSRAPEQRLYGSGTELYDPEVLPRPGTASLWFRRGTLWSGSPTGLLLRLGVRA